MSRATLELSALKMLASIIDYCIGNRQLSYRLKNMMFLFWDEPQTLEICRKQNFRGLTRKDLDLFYKL